MRHAAVHLLLCQCPSVATATLTDAAATTDGGPVDLPDVEFRNEFFGCVAG